MEYSYEKFFDSIESYQSYKIRFRERATKGELTSAFFFLLNNILSDKDIKNGFTPITNKNKLDNGRKEYSAIFLAYNELVHKIRWIKNWGQDLNINEITRDKLLDYFTSEKETFMRLH